MPNLHGAVSAKPASHRGAHDRRLDLYRSPIPMRYRESRLTSLLTAAASFRL
jgi:hypothetical protein